MSLQWFVNRKGTKEPIINGFSYYIHHNRPNGEILWRCTKARGKHDIKCRANATTFGDNIVAGRFIVADHNHTVEEVVAERAIKIGKINVDKK